MPSPSCPTHIIVVIAATGSLFAQSPLLLPPTIIEAERIDDEPSAVSVISGESLDLFQANSFSELSGIVPGFSVVSADSRGFGQVVVMRGSANTLFFGPPALGLSIDDVPLSDAYSYPSELLTLSQVRVHRGPHGPYFGLNGAAGMVEMFTPRPGEKNSTSFEAEYGSYDRLGFTLESSGPLNAALSYTLQLFHDQRDGFIQNTFLNDKTDDRQADGGLVNLFWNPSKDFELRLRFYTEHIDDGSQRLTSLSSSDPFTDSSDFRGSTDLERYQGSIHSRKDFDWGKLETISSYQTWDLNPSTVDLDLSNGTTPWPGFNGGFFTGLPADARSYINQSQDLFSNEIRFSSPEDAELRWKIGLFQMGTTSDGTARRTTATSFGGPFFTLLDETTRFSIDQLNLATYGNVTWKVTEQIAVDAGLRLDYNQAEMDRIKTDTIPGDSIINGNQEEWYISPVLGMTYTVNPTVDLFIRSSLGNKPGGFSAYSDTAALAEFDREKNWSNEIGVQYDNPENNLRVGLRGFWDQIDNYQFNQSAKSSTDFVTLNADEVTSRGVELDMAWAPVEKITVRSSFGYVNAEFDSYNDPFNTGISYNGKKVPFVPEYTGSLGVRYDFRNGFYAQTAARVSGDTQFDAGNASLFSQSAYIVWDAEVGYATNHFSIALFGRNLLDEDYYNFINPEIVAGSPGDPQVLGLRVKTTF